MLDLTETREKPPAAAAPRYDVSNEERLDDDAALRLWRHAETASVFNHPAWWRAALDSFGQGRRVIALGVRAGDGLCAYWPFWEKRLGPKDAFVRILEPVGSRMTDYVMPLIARGHDGPGLAAMMLRALEPRLSPSTMLLWPKADETALADEAVEGGFPAGRRLVHRRIRRCPRIALAPSYSGVEAGWSRNHRARVRQRVRKLGEQGPVSLQIAESRREIRDRLPVLFDMHRANWRVRGGCSEFDDPACVNFIEAIIDGLPTELLHYSEVHVGGHAVSCNLDFRRGDEILFYKGAFDLGFSEFSPGMVHFALAAQWAVENGLNVFDFLQGEEAYKLSWCNGFRETVSHAVAGRLGYPVWAWNTRLRKLIVEYKV